MMKIRALGVTPEFHAATIFSHDSRLYTEISLAPLQEKDFPHQLAKASKEEKNKYAKDLITAIAHLHLHGVQHRDLKLENINLDKQGNLKVFDLGGANIASCRPRTNSFNLTSTEYCHPYTRLAEKRTLCTFSITPLFYSLPLLIASHSALFYSPSLRQLNTRRTYYLACTKVNKIKI